MEITDKDITNIMLDIPHGFKVGNDHFMIFQPSLGVLHICHSIMEEMGISFSIISKNPMIEIFRIIHERRDLCCLYIAYNTFKDKYEILNYPLVHDRARYFENNLSKEDITLLLLQIIDSPSLAEISKHTGIAEEKIQMQRVQKAKKNDNTYVFGGKTIFGSLIGQACEKFHWSYDYVVWGISYLNLNLMLMDAVTSIYLTDEERKGAFIPSPNTKKIKVTSENIAEIKARFS